MISIEQAWKSMVYLKMVQKVTRFGAHDVLRRWKCLVCTAELSSQWNVIYHVRTNHFKNVQTNYNCRVCALVENVSFSEMRRHLESKHKLHPPLHRYYTASRTYVKENSDPNANQPTVPNLNSSHIIRKSVDLAISSHISETQEKSRSSAEADDKEDPNSAEKAQFLHYLRLGPKGTGVKPPQVVVSHRRSSRVAAQKTHSAHTRLCKGPTLLFIGDSKGILKSSCTKAYNKSGSIRFQR